MTVKEIRDLLRSRTIRRVEMRVQFTAPAGLSSNAIWVKASKAQLLESICYLDGDMKVRASLQNGQLLIG